MNEMKSKAIEKLMMVLDEVLGGDVASRLKEKMHESTEEEGEGEGEGKKMASGGASILALPEAESEEMPEESGKPKGIGIEVKDVKVAAMPRPGLMKRMHGGKKPA